MPNPHPTPRPRTRPVVLPPGVRDLRPKRDLFERRYRDEHTGERRSVYGRTLDDVMSQGTPALPVAHDARLTIAQYLDAWQPVGVRPNTAATHRGNVTRYLVPAFGPRTRLAQLDTPAGPDIIRDAYRRIRERPGRRLAPRTIELAGRTLSRALSQAREDRRIGTNPALGINPNGTRRTRATRVGVELPLPTDVELRAIEQAMQGHDWHPMYVVATLTGLRQSEMLGLTWADVEPLGSHRLRVTQGLRRYDRVIDEPKNDTSARTIRFHPAVTDALRARRRAQRLERIAAGRRWPKDGTELVFTNPTDGEPIAGRRVTDWLHDVTDALELPRYRWHDLRHAYATAILNRTHDLALAQKMLGHASPTITATLYHHLTDEGRDVAAAAAGEMLR